MKLEGLIKYHERKAYEDRIREIRDKAEVMDYHTLPDVRENLIGWIDKFLENGIVPEVVNPKEIRINYISKSKIQEKIKELYEEKDDKYYDMFLEQRDIEKTVSILKELMEDE